MPVRQVLLEVHSRLSRSSTNRHGPVAFIACPSVMPAYPMCMRPGPSKPVQGSRCLTFRRLPNGWLVGQFPALELLGIRHLVTTRLGPNIHQARHQTELIASQLAGLLGLADFAFLRQIHGSQVLMIEGGGGLVGQADGLCTRSRGLLLVAKSGDCPIVLVADRTGKAVGFAHASWRATVAGIVPNLIRCMLECGCRPEDLVACICPSIGPECFQVGQDVLAAALDGIGPHAEGFFLRRPQGLFMDLWMACACALRTCGLQEIYVSEVCSTCRPELFPSHRRDGPQAGRFLVSIGLP